jgi:hypothetical protein
VTLLHVIDTSSYRHLLTPFLPVEMLSLSTRLLAQASLLCHERFNVCTIDLSCEVLCEAVTSVFLCPDKDDLDETFLDKFTHKMIPCINVLCPLTSRNVFCHEDSSDIVDATNHWECHWDSHADEYLHDKFDFLCCLR